MKKNIIYLCTLTVFIVLVIGIFTTMHHIGVNPFRNVGKTIQNDYTYNRYIFEKIATNNQEDTFITKENYDKSSEELHFIFDTLKYESIRISYGTVFFCKNYDGMTRIGLFFSNYSYKPTPKQNIVKKLSENWIILEEHIL